MDALSPFETRYAYWWLTSDPSVRVLGTLTQESDEYLLTLNGLLGEPADGTLGEDLLSGEHRLRGADDIGFGATLEGCFVKRADRSPWPPRQVWVVNELILGAVFENAEPWVFFGVRYRVPLLSGFKPHKPLQRNRSHDAAHGNTTVTYSIPLQSWPLWTQEGCEVSLVTHLHRTDLDESRAEFDARIDLLVHTHEAVERERFLRSAVRPLQVLVGLATGEFTVPTGATALIEPYQAEGGNEFLPLYFRTRVVKDFGKSVRYGFHYPDVLALGEPCITSWLLRLSRMAPVTDLYVALLHEHPYAESAFLLAVQALETYHRRTSSGTLVEPTLWDPLRSNLAALIEATLPETDERSALITKLGFHNELSLAQRLKSLLERVGPRKHEICGTDRDHFVSRVVRTRNFFTHWDPQSERRAVRGVELVHLTGRLMALLEILLLQDLGLGEHERALKTILERRVRWLPIT